MKQSRLTCLGRPYGQGGDQVHSPQHAVGHSEVPGQSLHQLHGSAEAGVALGGRWQSAAAGQQAAVLLRGLSLSRWGLAEWRGAPCFSTCHTYRRFSHWVQRDKHG